MSEPSQSRTQRPSDKLRTMRNDFAEASRKTLADMDERIAEALQLERRQQLASDLKAFIPGEDAAILKGHDIAFLINKSKDMGKNGASTPIGVSFAAAHHVYATVLGSDIRDVTVSAAFWGDRIGAILPARLEKGPTAYDGSTAEAKEFLPMVQALLAATPAVPSDNSKHYIVISDGNVAGNIDQATAILETVSKLNPKATFDFIVLNTADTALETLVKKWNDDAAARPNLVKVATAAEITGAALNIIKARVGGSAYTPAAPAVTAAPTKEEAKPAAAKTTLPAAPYIP